MSDSRKIWVWDDDVAMMETKLEATQQTAYVRADRYDEVVAALKSIVDLAEVSENPDGPGFSAAAVREFAEPIITKAEELK